MLQWVVQGQSNPEVSHQLAIGEATVRTHVSSILAKLNPSSRTQAALYALQKGHCAATDLEPDQATHTTFVVDNIPRLS